MIKDGYCEVGDVLGYALGNGYETFKAVVTRPGPVGKFWYKTLVGPNNKNPYPHEQQSIYGQSYWTRFIEEDKIPEKIDYLFQREDDI